MADTNLREAGARAKERLKSRLDPRVLKLLGRRHEARYEAAQLVDRLTGRPAERARFARIHGYPLNLDQPRSYSEKLTWRKLHDRNPLFPIVVDKYRVRSFVQRLLGEEDAERYLIPLLFVARDAASIPFDRLPDEYVVKLNHGSAMNLVVRREHGFTRDEIARKCDAWLRTPHGLQLHEWAYRKVPRRIVGEQLITGRDGSPPNEIKLHMFDGELGLIQTLESETWYDGHNLDAGPIPTLTYYTPQWEKVQISVGFPTAPDGRRPHAEFEECMSIARRLSSPFDYVRVDLYLTEDGIRFGELTVYPSAGIDRIPRAAVDFELGKRWRLPR